jgi:hypothetical protein
MKKLFSVIAMIAVVGTVLLSGCKKDDAPPPPAEPPTNAPAPAK